MLLLQVPLHGLQQELLSFLGVRGDSLPGERRRRRRADLEGLLRLRRMQRRRGRVPRSGVSRLHSRHLGRDDGHGWRHLTAAFPPSLGNVVVLRLRSGPGASAASSSSSSSSRRLPRGNSPLSRPSPTAASLLAPGGGGWGGRGVPPEGAVAIRLLPLLLVVMLLLLLLVLPSWRRTHDNIRQRVAVVGRGGKRGRRGRNHDVVGDEGLRRHRGLRLLLLLLRRPLLGGVRPVVAGPPRRRRRRRPPRSGGRRRAPVGVVVPVLPMGRRRRRGAVASVRVGVRWGRILPLHSEVTGSLILGRGRTKWRALRRRRRQRKRERKRLLLAQLSSPEVLFVIPSWTAISASALQRGTS